MKTKDSKREDEYKFPSSVQSELFGYLTDEQKEYAKPVLRVMKKWAQESLCYMLLDYIETGKAEPGPHLMVTGMFTYLTRHGMADLDSPGDPRIIRPLNQRKSLSAVINTLSHQAL